MADSRGNELARDPAPGAVHARLHAAASRLAAEGPGPRRRRLRRLREALLDRREEALAAVDADFGHARGEALITELLVVTRELRHAERQLARWMAPRPAHTPLLLAGTRSRVRPVPLGATLVLAPWNYPLNLSLVPLTAAIAAGNPVLLKPSEHTPHAAAFLHELLGSLFPPDEVAVVQGGPQLAAELCRLPWGHIFFTGSAAVGREVAAAAARQLVPTTLELGGKSPAVVLAGADLDRAARRIVAGKFLNAGQTCIAPDHVLVQRELAGELGRRLVEQAARQYGDGSGMTRLLGRERAARQRALVEDALAHGGELLCGGEIDVDGGRAQPTVLRVDQPAARVLREEIFGPILPVVAVDGVDEALDRIAQNPDPLALYAFGDRTRTRELLARARAGTVCVDDCVVHFGQLELPFGGVGGSGHGQYHGRHGFDRFSQLRPELRSGRFALTRLLHPQGGRFPAGLARRMLHWPFLWAMLALWLPAVAGAQGKAITMPEADGGWRGRPVSGLELSGLPEGTAGELRGGLELSGHRRFWFDRHPDYFPDRLQADLERTRLYLARRGWPYSRARATGELDGAELRLRIEVEPGPRVHATEVAMAGWPPATPAPSPAPSTLRGEPYVESRFGAAVQGWRDQLRDEGFARATVEQELARLAADSIRVVLRARPGPRFRMGDLQVSGVDEDLEHVVKRRVDVHEGEWYSPRHVADAEEDLREMQLFRRIEVGTTAADSSTLDLDLSLRPREMRTIELGAGWYSDEGPRGRAAWVHRNLFRRGRGLRLSLEGSRYLQAARGVAWWPALWASDTQGQLDGSWRREDEDSYLLVEERLRGSLVHSLGGGQRVRGSATVSYVDVDARVDELRDRAEPVGIISYLGAGWELYRTDDRLDPRDGGYARSDLEYVPPGLGSVSRHLRFVAEGAHYIPVGAEGTWAFHLLAGLAWPQGDTDRVFASRRFYGGGALSVRSFPRRGLGPRDDLNRAIGGEAQLEASTEWRFGLLGPVGGALFVDAGQVWERPAQLGWGELAWAAGPSLMVSTPVGPIRADWGFRVGGHPERDPDHVFHLTIGHPW